MTIFEILAGITTTKNLTLLDKIDDQQSFQPFMVNRWLSMHSPGYAQIVNETVNRYGTCFKDNTDTYKFLVNIMPVAPTRRINYIKKKKIVD